MLFKGDVTIHAPRKKFGVFLLIQTGLAHVLGVEKIETIKPNKKYRGMMSIGLGSVKSKLSEKLKSLSLMNPIVQN